MRKLIVAEYTSLDGVIQGPGHADEDTDGGFEAGGWTQPLMPDHRRYNTESFQTAGAFLLGRRTYEIWAEYWPTVTDETDLIAKALNEQPKYVASTTLDKAVWKGTTIIRDVPIDVARLKSQPGRPIFVMGSSALAHALMEHGLVDEYQLWLHPVVLGRGKRLFREGGPGAQMRLIDCRVSTGGLVILTYGSSNP
jgi:dihydrofolate reductase